MKRKIKRIYKYVVCIFGYDENIIHVDIYPTQIVQYKLKTFFNKVF